PPAPTSSSSSSSSRGSARCQSRRSRKRAAASVRRVCGSADSLASLSAVGSSGERLLLPARRKAADLRSHGRTDPGGQRGGDRPGSARLASSSPLPSSGAVEKPGRRPAVCAQPPAGLRPGLPLFSRKMDGFTGSLGGASLREAYSMSCIANGGTSGRKRDSTSVTRKETVSSAAKSGADRKKEVSSQRSQMEEIQEREEPPHPKDSSPSPSSPHPPQTPPTPQPQRPAQSADSSKGHAPPKRGPSVKRSSGMERSQSSTWETSDESRNKLVKAASTSKLLAKVVKNAERHKEPVVSQDGNPVKMFMRGRPITMFVPSDLENLYGYRGRDCRANIYLLPTGEIVYFIASVVVLFNYEERTQRHYLGHTDCVKCLAIHPDKIRIATGQIAGVDKDGRALQPHVRIWDSVSLSTLQIVGMGTFERGVGSLAFSKADSGQHLSVIDDCNDHMLTVWDWQKKSKIAEIKTTNEVVLAVEFHPTDPNTIVTCGKSHIFFWTWSGTSLARKQGIFGCLAFLSTGDILTGDSGGILLVWTRSSAETPTGKGPRGGKDRKIILWDHELRADRDIEVPDQYGTIRAVSEGKGEEFLVGTSRNFILRGTFNDGFLVEVQGHTDELWGLASHPSREMFLTCAQDRLVCLWNSSDHSLQWSRMVEEHGHCADFHPSGAVVAIGTHSGKWYVLDAETTDLVAIHTDGNEQLSVMRFSVGDVPNGCKLIRNRSECKDIDWATYTCVLGYQAPSHKYSAHSSHVTNVSFLYNDSHLISTGGKDTSIMQWRLVEKSSLSLTDGLLSNSAPRRADPTYTPAPPAVATPAQEPNPPPTANGTQEEASPDTPPPLELAPPTSELTPPHSESTPPPSDSTVSLKDSLEPSDDTATPSDEGLPPLTPRHRSTVCV
ncbi:hypothetical protein INR49_020337, partial [Caranx melampygus]